MFPKSITSNIKLTCQSEHFWGELADSFTQANPSATETLFYSSQHKLHFLYITAFFMIFCYREKKDKIWNMILLLLQNYPWLKTWPWWAAISDSSCSLKTEMRKCENGCSIIRIQCFWIKRRKTNIKVYNKAKFKCLMSRNFLFFGQQNYSI